MMPFSNWLQFRFAPSLLLCLSAAAAGSLSAQDAARTGSLMGKVRDSEGHVLPGASVTVRRIGLAAADGPHVLAVTTDRNGIYLVPSLAYGAYAVQIAPNGSQLRQAVDVQIKAAKTEADVSFDNHHVPPSPLADLPPRQDLGLGTEPAAPTFLASGVEGTMAPSGYATGASAEESAQVMAEARKVLPPEIDLSSLFSYPLGCGREPELTRNVAGQPGSAEDNRLLGLFYLQHGEPDSGLPFLERASTLQPANADSWLDLGAADVMLNRLAAAVTTLQKAVALAPPKASAHRLLAAALAGTGDLTHAVSEYRRAIDLDPSEDNLLRSAVGLLAAGRPEAAIGILREATLRYPEASRLWLGLGIAQALTQQALTQQNLTQQGPDAVASLLKASALAPASAAANSFLAELAGTSPSADEQIRVVLRNFVLTHPEEARAHLDYALFLSKERGVTDPSSYTEVERQLRSAIEHDPQLTAAHFQLGVLYAEAGKDQEAIQALTNVVRLQPENAHAHYRLALAYRRQKMMEASAQEMAAFHRLHADSPDGTAVTPEDAAMALFGDTAANRRCPAPK